MHDELKRFKKRGIVQMVLLSNKVVVVRPDKSIGLQIILCGLLLALQLVGGEKHYESSLFEDTDYELQQFSFADILKLTSKHVNKAQLIYDKIEKEFARPAGVRVEETLKKALFPLLQAAKKAAGRAKKDSEMSEVEI